jgi:hypothetical protein
MGWFYESNAFCGCICVPKAEVGLSRILTTLSLHSLKQLAGRIKVSIASSSV